MPQRVKQLAKHAARLDKLAGNGKHVNSRRVMNSYGGGACTRLKHHPLVSSQYRGGGP